MADSIATAAAAPTLRAALKQKLGEISTLENTYDRQRGDTFYATTSMLLGRILGAGQR
jgi:hypothetical protein